MVSHCWFEVEWRSEFLHISCRIPCRESLPGLSNVVPVWVPPYQNSQNMANPKMEHIQESLYSLPRGPPLSSKEHYRAVPVRPAPDEDRRVIWRFLLSVVHISSLFWGIYIYMYIIILYINTYKHTRFICVYAHMHISINKREGIHIFVCCLYSYMYLPCLALSRLGLKSWGAPLS